MSISGYVTKGIDVIVGIIVLFLLYANLIPEAQSAGDDLNASGVPLGSLFTASGFVFILVMVGLLFLVVKLVMPSGKK
jgi:hypothetical protein